MEDFTLDRLVQMQEETSIYSSCDKEIDYVVYSKYTYNNPSLDRSDNSQGYTKENVSIICRRCNYLKSDFSIEGLGIMIKWLEKITKEGAIVYPLIEMD